MYKAVFFDLDGTLLPMDLGEFMKHYMHSLAAFCAARGIDGQAVVDGIWAGLGTTMKNQDGRTNSERFWEAFGAYMAGERGIQADWTPLFDEFYSVEFPKLREKTGTNPLAVQAVNALHEKGYRLALATNPVFPATATAQRLSWTGVDPSLFERVTSYENCRSVKPYPDYYQDLLEELGLRPDEVLMVGNDTRDDAAVLHVGMDVYIVTDCLEVHEKGSVDLDELSHGTMRDFLAFAQGLPARD